MKYVECNKLTTIHTTDKQVSIITVYYRYCDYNLVLFRIFKLKL